MRMVPLGGTLAVLAAIVAFLHAVQGTDHVEVGSCTPGERVSDCGYHAMTSCVAGGCCWNETTIPACVKPVKRAWNACSAKCRHRGVPGRRREKTLKWKMPCNSFPCRLKTPCACSRMDLVILLDVSSAVSERDFWANKQLVLDIITAYKEIGHDTHVAMVTYDGVNELVFGFKDGLSLDDLHGLRMKIWMIPYEPHAGGTNLLTGLTRAESVLSMGRHDTQHVLLVVSGGSANRPWKLAEVADRIRGAGVIIHAVHPGYVTGLPRDAYEKAVFTNLVASDHHIFTLDDYNDRTALVTAVISEWCCPKQLQRMVNAIYDDEGDIYINGQFHSHVTFKETAAFIVPDKPRNLVAMRIDNILNPEGRYFEVWPTGARGVTLLTLPYQWRCHHKEYDGWYDTEFDDTLWKEARVVERTKDRLHIGARGQQRVWTSAGNWTAYCRGWTEELCNNTRMPGVTCSSTGRTSTFGGCTSAYDGMIWGRDADWVTSRATEATLTMNFTRPANVRELGLMNRCTYRGQAKDIRITFSDGSIHQMELPCNAYSDKVDACDGMDYSWMTFDPVIQSSTVAIEIVSVCFTGRRMGLREVQILGEPPCW